MSVVIKKRGRPTKADVAARVEAQKALIVPAKSDAEILADIKEGFDILAILVAGVIAGNVRSLMVAGAPGTGKSFLIEAALRAARNAEETRYEIISGGISAIGLYKLGYRLRNKNCVIVMDDSDGIFNDDEALAVLKAMCDSSQYRTVHWLKESSALKDEGDEIPTSYDFSASMIFVTNLDIQRYIDEGKNRYAPHFEALQSRSLYLDLMIHNRNQIAVWVNHMANNAGIFADHNIDDEGKERIMSYINKHRMELRELSLRTIVKSCELLNANGEDFERIARRTLNRGMY